MANQWVNRFSGNRVSLERNRKRRTQRRRLTLQSLIARQMLAGDLISSDPNTLESDPAALIAPANAPSLMAMSQISHGSQQHGAHPAAMELVSADQATHRVVASGNWSDPNVWENQILPTDGARILIPQGETLTVDSVLTNEFKTIGIHGTLRFATNVNTELRVDTIVSAPHGRFEMGTASNPIASDVTARVVFADDGVIDTTWDPEQLSRGAVLQGATQIHGAEKTHRVTLASFTSAGATSIELSSVPENWTAGDEIVVTGTQGSTSDEVRVIESIDGATVTFASPLELDHVPPSADLNVYVANKSRNVQFSSENPEVAHRGHIMLMHTLDVNIQNAEFENLGRTDKNRELDDLLFEFDDNAVGNFTSAPTVYTVTNGERTNVRGRYAVHFHRGGVDPNSTPATIAGSVVDGSPGWGIVSHSSNVNVVNNVAYGVQGAAFYTEVGDEIGSMVGNIAIRTVSPSFRLDDEGAIDPDLRADRMDFGVDGDGYWLSGHMVSMQDNVSAGASGHGFIIWSDGVIEPDLARGRSSVLVAYVDNGHLITGRETIPTWWAPLAEIRNNESYGATIGFRSRYVHSQGYLGEIGSDFHTPPDQAYIDTLNPTIDGLTVWGSRDGVLLNYNERMSIKNARLIGIGAPYVQNGGTADTGVGIDMYNEVTRGPGSIENVTIEGFNMGLLAPRQDDWRLNNLQLRNTTDVLITEMIEGPRTLEMTNVTFGSLTGTAVEDQASNRRNIVMRAEFEANSVHPFNFLMSDRVTLDGQQLYFDEQAADFIPTAGEIAESPGPVPSSMIGLTNQQLLERFGTSFGGAIIPDDATTVDYLVGGVVGGLAPPPATSPPIYHPASESAGPNGLIIDPGTLTDFEGPVVIADDEDEGDIDDDGGADEDDDADDSDRDEDDGDSDSEEDDADDADSEENDTDDGNCHLDDDTDEDDDDAGAEGDTDEEEGDDEADEPFDDDEGDTDEDDLPDDDLDDDQDSDGESDDEDLDEDDSDEPTTEDDEDDDPVDDEDDDPVDDEDDELGEDDGESGDESDGGENHEDGFTDDEENDGDDEQGDIDAEDETDEDEDDSPACEVDDEFEDDDLADDEFEDDELGDREDGGEGDDDDSSSEDESESDDSAEVDEDEPAVFGEGSDFHNDRLPTDVNVDGETTSLDALVVINFLSQHGSQFLQTLSMALRHYVDVNNDDSASALDALRIINAIAEGQFRGSSEDVVDDVIGSTDFDTDEDDEELFSWLSESSL